MLGDLEEEMPQGVLVEEDRAKNQWNATSVISLDITVMNVLIGKTMLTF